MGLKNKPVTFMVCQSPKTTKACGMDGEKEEEKKESPDCEY